MSSVDPRTPVLVGAGQVSAREREDASPLELMVEAAQRAFADCGGARMGSTLLHHLDQVSVPYAFTWPVPDPARLVAAELGVSGAETVRSASGGTAPLHLLAHAAERIAIGEIDVCLLTGGEAVRPFMRAMAAGAETGWPTQEQAVTPDRFVGSDDRDFGHPAELEAGLVAPINYYPLFEHAIRASAGRGVDEHRAWLGELWARFAAVAAGNPHAWGPTGLGAEEIAEPSEGNRMAVDPYTKLLTANIQVDQGAAVLLCSAEAADAAGVPADRRAYVRAAAAATDHWFAVNRERLDRSPAIAACGREAMRHSDLAIDEIEHLDLYSCFPSAVQIAATELGIDLAEDSRPPTVNGGLTFAGGPANNSCAHALAAMLDRLREAGGSGLVTGIGWYMTKHAVMILSADPPPRPFAAYDVQADVDALPARAAASEASGPAPVEAYTAVHDRDGTATIGIVSCLLADDSRALAKSVDRATIDRLLDADPIGAEVELRGAEFDL